MSYFKEITSKWSDIDANGHMRNTAYNEYCTHVRYSFFAENGFDVKTLSRERISPVTLREEALYMREVRLMEQVTVTLELAYAKPDYSKFIFEQYVIKENGKKAAKLTIEGIWMDMQNRKPIVPMMDLVEVCEKIPKSKDFEWI